MRTSALIVAIGLVAAACSSTGTGATVTTTVLSESTTTTTVPPTTVTTTTTAPALTGAACVPGSWVLDSDAFFVEVAASMSDDESPGEFRYLDGVYRLTFDGDGSANEERDHWTFLVRAEYGDLVMTVDSEAAGAYALGDGVLSLELDRSPASVEILIDGLPIEFPPGTEPAQVPDVSLGAVPYTCSGDTLVTTADGVTSTWSRSP